MTIETLANRREASLPRRPADAHFRKPGGDPKGGTLQRAGGELPGQFEIYRQDEVRMTSTRFSGGDWHWRLSDADGLVLLDTGGYASERECLLAVAILQQTAAFARISRPG